MSELKATTAYDAYWKATSNGDNSILVYLKSEADKVIAELKEERRWRKLPDEKPENGQDVWAYDSKSKSVLHLEYEKSDEGEGFIVFPYKHDFQQNITQWMPFEKPKAPEADK